MNDTRRQALQTVALIITMLAVAGLYVTNRNDGVHGQATTVTGPMRTVSFNFDSSGAPLAPIYCAVLTGTVSTSGTFSLTGVGPLVNGSAAWTNPGGAWFEMGGMMSAGTAVGSNYIPFITTFTVSSNNITLSGVAKSPTTLIVLGATAVASTVAEPITAKVCAN